LNETITIISNLIAIIITAISTYHITKFTNRAKIKIENGTKIFDNVLTPLRKVQIPFKDINEQNINKIINNIALTNKILNENYYLIPPVCTEQIEILTNIATIYKITYKNGSTLRGLTKEIL
jgi:hypothetical protein